MQLNLFSTKEYLKYEKELMGGKCYYPECKCESKQECKKEK